MQSAEPLRVWYPQPPDNERAMDCLRGGLPPRVQLVTGDTPPPGYEVLVAGRPEAAWLTDSPALHTLIIPWAGLPESTRDLVQQHAPSLAVHNLHHNAAATAETAVALLLAAARRLLPADRKLRQHDWTPRYNPAGSLQLAGGTALVAGYGAIGQRVARVCVALGMTVHATRRQQAAPDTDGAIHLHPAGALHDLLPQVDALVICLPLTPLTRGLIGAGQLASMRRHAVIVNIGRAPIIDEAALFHALRDGTIGSAGLDVWYRYPPPDQPEARTHTPPSEFPFGELDNVVMSPHRAGWAPDTDLDRMHDLLRLLQAMADGAPVPQQLDLDAGY